jgi:hypothetical protein
MIALTIFYISAMRNKLKFVMLFKAIALTIMTVQMTGFGYLLPVIAQSSTTSVTISNSAPTFSVNPFEDPASTGTAPTDVGTNVTFRATGDDPNFDNYYLLVCRTNSATANNSAAPSCAPSEQLCVSSSTTNLNQASCTYTAQNSDAEVVAWYAFVCDGVASGSSCSSSNQGTGDSGSPFHVNHRPSFTSTSANSANPSGTITFSTVASDPDTDTVADTVKVVICENNNGASFAGTCNVGPTLCSSSLVANNPSCTYDLPGVIPAGNYTYYAYIFDNHQLAAANNPQSSTYTVNNVAPVVSNVVLNGSNDITLAENTTTNTTVTATITDNNSCQDIVTVRTNTYRSGIGNAGCTANNANNCYYQVTCTVVGGTCTGNTDPSANYTCTVTLQYHADPTDVNTQYPAQNWLATVEAIDGGSNSHDAESASGVEMISLVALNVTSSINYGSLSTGQSSPTNQTSTVTATGNTGIDTELSGTVMTNGLDNIPVANQQYDAVTFNTGLSEGIALTASPVLLALNVNKTTVTASPANDPIYWGITIPAAISSGTYTGTNTVTAVKSNPANW